MPNDPETNVKNQNTPNGDESPQENNNDNNEPDFSNLPKETQDYIKTLRNEAAGNRVKAKEYETKLDELNEKLEQIEKEKKEKIAEEEKQIEEEAKKKGDHEKIINTKNKQIETLKTENETLIEEVRNLRKLRDDMLEKMVADIEDESLRESLKATKDIDLIESVKSNIVKKQNSPGAENRSQNHDRIEIEKMTSAELQEFARNNPEQYRKLILNK